MFASRVETPKFLPEEVEEEKEMSRIVTLVYIFSTIDQTQSAKGPLLLNFLPTELILQHCEIICLSLRVVFTLV